MSSPSRREQAFLKAAQAELSVGVRGVGAIGLQLAGTFVGTVSFEATIDGDTWVALNLVPSNSATAASSATAAGCWTGNVAGFEAVRARCSAYTSGTIKATLISTEAPGRY